MGIGSLEGSGPVFLGANALVVGGNDLSTIYSGNIQDGGNFGGTGGSLAQVGSGTLTLSGVNTYTGGTTVYGSSLFITNRHGSGTGSGNVQVDAGLLGGTGKIAGRVVVGTGSGPGAFLSPGRSAAGTLRLQKTLTFKADATYTCKLNAKKAKADQVVANGVTIESGATFSFQGTAQGTLTQGFVLTVISNTAATPISGTFSNLADGAIVSVNGNNLQASYEGGDGNDLTLTVVP